MTVEPGAPRKVVRWASEHGGVHNDCLVAQDPCQACRRSMSDAMDHFYGSSMSPAELFLRVMADFIAEALEDGLIDETGDSDA